MGTRSRLCCLHPFGLWVSVAASQGLSFPVGNMVSPREVMRTQLELEHLWLEFSFH